MGRLKLKKAEPVYTLDISEQERRYIIASLRDRLACVKINPDCTEVTQALIAALTENING